MANSGNKKTDHDRMKRLFVIALISIARPASRFIAAGQFFRPEIKISLKSFQTAIPRRLASPSIRNRFSDRERKKGAQKCQDPREFDDFSIPHVLVWYNHAYFLTELTSHQSKMAFREPPPPHQSVISGTHVLI